MPTDPIYVPMLNGKEGEFAALEELAVDVRDHMIPFIELPDIPYDYVNDVPAKALEEHVSGVANRLRKCWTNRPLYLELPWSGAEEQLGGGRVAFEAVLSDCSQLGVEIIPVVSRATSGESREVAQRHATASGLGACIRLRVEDFEEEVDLETDVDRLLASLGGVGIGSIDLILDLGDIGSESGRAVLIARSLFSMIPKGKEDWRRIILAAASFPKDLSDVDAQTFATLPRREWELWRTLQKRPNNLPRRDLVFGDYAIAHPDPKGLDPRTMRMSANIRYTTADDWLVAKGRNVRQYGFGQYFELCKTLVDRPEYAGPGFSWGDKYIRDCADGIQGPGNATTWRKVGTNHHLTVVAKAIANSARVA